MKKDLKKATLEKIRKEDLKPKPKSYFQVVKVFLYGLSVLLFLLAIYTFNLMFYLPGRSLRMLESGRAVDYLRVFPWPLLIIGSATVGLLIFLYHNYEGGYKKRLGIVALVGFGLLIILGAALAGSRLNEGLERGPHFRRFYQWNEDNFVPRGSRHNLRIQGSFQRLR
jgi:hypothetical protein